MNFSTIEDSILEEKKKFNNFLSRFLKNSRVLIILLIAAAITAVSVSMWIKSPEYQVLYNHLSGEDSNAVINQLNQMKIPYQFIDISGKILVPENKVDEVRLRLAENKLPLSGAVGFELLDKEKFGISQFNEQINYQRALEGELARTIQRINIVKNARIHIAFPKSSLFLQQDKKKPSASVVLELKQGEILDAGQINAILHLISSSISNLSVENITIVDQLGNLLNQSFLKYDQVNNFQLKYSEDVESRYRNRIKSILEPLVGIGNVYAQVTAQIDFNDKEKTQEKYSPNSEQKNKSIRSSQISIHDQVQNKNLQEPESKIKKNDMKTISDSKNHIYDNFLRSSDSDINHDNRVNYELDHSVSHIKMNVGEIKRLSSAVIVNYVKDKNGEYLPLSSEKLKSIEYLIREAVGYSESRGDSIHLVNEPFAKYSKKIPVQKINDLSSFKLSDTLYSATPWLISFFLFLILLKKYVCPSSNKHILNKKVIKNEQQNLGKDQKLEEYISGLNIKSDLKTDKIIHQICSISNNNPRTIALIIRQWMSDKI